MWKNCASSQGSGVKAASVCDCDMWQVGLGDFVGGVDDVEDEVAFRPNKITTRGTQEVAP